GFVQLVFGYELHSIRIAFEPVADDDRKGQRSVGPLYTSEVMVIVVVGSHGYGKPLARLHAISELISDELFRIKIRTTPKQERWASRNEKLAVDTRRCSDRPGHRCPQAPLRAHLPHEAGRRLKFKPRVIVMLDFRSQRQMQ